MASMRLKITALVAGVCAGAVALIMTSRILDASAQAQADAMAQQDGALRVAALALDLTVPGFEAATTADGALTRLSWTGAPDFEDHALIDRIGGAAGALATIFVLDPTDGEFIRRTTTVKKPDGARAVGTPLGKAGPVHPVVASGRTYAGEAAILGRDHFTRYMPIFGPAGGVEGVLFVGAPKAGVTAAAWATALGIARDGLIALALGAAAAWLLTGPALRGLDRFGAALARVAGGDLATPVGGQDRRDEIGALAQGLERLREGLSAAQAQRAGAQAEREAMLDALERGVGGVVARATAGDFAGRIGDAFAEPRIAALADGVNRVCAVADAFLADLRRSVAAMAEGDLTTRVGDRHVGQFADVAGAVNATLDRMTDLIGRIQRSADAGMQAVERIGADAGELSGRAESQAASLEQTAATMEEMAASVKSNAAALVKADDIAADMRRRAAEGAATVAQAVEAVNRIKTSSDQISGIIAMIEAIAWQTNLLALNASVEAARAGDAGRGFAVVASEVRALAQRAAEAARDISGLVRASADAVVDGIDRVERTGAALDGIRQTTDTLAGMLGAVSAAGREQASGVGEINAAVAQMDRLTQENAGLTDRFAGGARTLAQEIGALRDAAAAFATRERAPDARRSA